MRLVALILAFAFLPALAWEPESLKPRGSKDTLSETVFLRAALQSALAELEEIKWSREEQVRLTAELLRLKGEVHELERRRDNLR
jgi:hypothetical protein